MTTRVHVDPRRRHRARGGGRRRARHRGDRRGDRVGAARRRRRRHPQAWRAAARSDAGVDPTHAALPQGAAGHAHRRRLRQRQRGAAAGVRSLRQRPPGAHVRRAGRSLRPASIWSSCARTPRANTPASSTTSIRRANAAEAISIITRHGCDRIVRFAFEYARANGRKQVTLVHKANILKMTSGLFLQIGREIAASLPRHRVQRPHRRQHGDAAGARPDAGSTSS